MSAGVDFELDCPLCGAGPGVMCDCISFGADDITKEIEAPPTRICECGAESVKSNIHSNWCPKNGE